MQEVLVLRVGAIQVLDEAHELYPGKPRQRPLYRSPVLCHDSSPFQFLHGIFSSDIVRKVKSSSQCAGNGPLRTLTEGCDVAPQLCQTGHSCIVQHFVGQNVGLRDGADSRRSHRLLVFGILGTPCAIRSCTS